MTRIFILRKSIQYVFEIFILLKKLAICFSNEVEFVITDRDIPNNCELGSMQSNTNSGQSNEIQSGNDLSKKLK